MLAAKSLHLAVPVCQGVHRELPLLLRHVVAPPEDGEVVRIRCVGIGDTARPPALTAHRFGRRASGGTRRP